MACMSNTRQGQLVAERITEVNAAVARLKAALAAGTVSVVVGRQGGVAFRGWEANARAGISDACAFRSLSAEGSAELRRALARAEVTSGYKANLQAVAAGVHSHDGGKSWSRH